MAEPIEASAVADTDIEKAMQEDDNGSTNPSLTSTHKSPSTDEQEVSPPAPISGTLDAVPDGGIDAWLQVIGSFFLNMNNWGIINSFGIYQTFYETSLFTSSTSSDISWIGSTQAFLLLLIGVISGPIYDAGYFRTLIFSGSLFIVFGLMMTSLVTEYWQAMLAQGICVGIGAGLVFVPSFAIIPQYFARRKSFAIGIAASGSSVGGVLYPIVFHRIEPIVGFGWATRVIAFLALFGFVVSNLVMKERAFPKEKRALIEHQAFKEAPFSFFTASMFFSFAGLYIPIFYIQTYSIQSGIANANLGFYLLPILNASSILGRILPNFFADKTGALNMLVPCALAASVLSFGWIGVHSLPAVIIFSLLYGFFSGAFVSLLPSVIVGLTPDLRKIGTRMGMCFGVTSFGVLIGTPVAGAILTNTGKYLDMQLFGGCILMLGLLLMLCARYTRYGPEIWIKA
ncbi:hypothetical protein MMC25_000263 [Agyrium rufum]|nr:hypothetical protein [Agyrium rufum]